LSALHIVKFQFALDKELIKKMLPSALVLGSISVVSILYLYVDKVILFQMKSSQEVGLYSAASKIMLFVRGIVFLYMPVAFPAFSSFSVNMSDRYFHKFLTRSFYYILIFTSAIALGGTILAPQIMILIFGAGYVDAIPSLKIIIWALPLTCLSGLISCGFIGIGRNKETLFVWIGGFLVNILINICFIGTYGYYATSIAVVISEFIMLTVFTVSAYKILEFKISTAKLLQIFLSLCFLGLFLLNFHSADVILNIVLGGLLYSLSLIVFKAVNQEDWALLKKIMLKQI
jgi:O-antigen/teichoic acid export membrane protein